MCHNVGTSGVQRLNPGDNTITSFVRRDSDMSEKDYSVLKSTNELRNRTTLPLGEFFGEKVACFEAVYTSAL